MHSTSATSYAYNTRVVCFSCTLHAAIVPDAPATPQASASGLSSGAPSPCTAAPLPRCGAPGILPRTSCGAGGTRTQRARRVWTEANATRVGGTGDLRAGGLPPEQPVRQILGRVQRPQASAGSLLQSGGAPWGAAHVLLGGCCRRTRHSRFFGGDARCVRCDACTRRGDSRRVWRGW